MGEAISERGVWREGGIKKIHKVEANLFIFVCVRRQCSLKNLDSQRDPGHRLINVHQKKKNIKAV